MHSGLIIGILPGIVTNLIEISFFNLFQFLQGVYTFEFCLSRIRVVFKLADTISDYLVSDHMILDVFSINR